MIKRFCDWCSEQVADADLMPGGGGNPLQRLGMEVRAEVGDATGDVITVAVGPIGVNGLFNSAHFHKGCVQKIVAEGQVQ